MRVILLGAPGAGKGTQASAISEKFGIPHVSTGDIFRYHIKNDTELGKKVKSFTESGKLVPDELTCEILWSRIDEDDAKDGFLLDGFPRTVAQAENLEQGLEKRGEKLDAVVLLEVPNEELVKRLSGRRVCSACGTPYHTEGNMPKVEGVCDKCGGEVVRRKDDEEATVRGRIDVYERETAPLIDFYAKRGILERFDGMRDIKSVEREILDRLSDC